MTCPNCAQEFEGNRCPNCGRPATNASSRIAAVFILVFLVLPAGLFGACSVVSVFSSLSAQIFSLMTLLFLVLSAVGLGVAYWAMKKVKDLWG